MRKHALEITTFVLLLYTLCGFGHELPPGAHRQFPASDTLFWYKFDLKPDSHCATYDVVKLEESIAPYYLALNLPSSKFGKCYQIGDSVFVKRFVLVCANTSYMRLVIDELKLDIDTKFYLYASNETFMIGPITTISKNWSFKSTGLPFIGDNKIIIEVTGRDEKSVNSASFSIPYVNLGPIIVHSSD